jgi:hypothetical protein
MARNLLAATVCGTKHAAIPADLSKPKCKLPPSADSASSLWARVVESDMPVFTLLISGMAAAAKTVEQIAQHL